MRMRSLYLLAVAVAIVFCRAAVLADSEPVEVTSPPAVKIKAGQTVRIPLHITVAKGWHIFGADWNSPTRIELGSAKGVSAAPPQLPAAHKVHIAAINQDANVYEGAVLVPLVITAAKNASAGPQSLDGTVRYQACSDAVCRLPKKASFKVAVEVVK